MTQEPPLGAPTGHLDLETLADLEEGLLPADDAAAHQAHLATCAQCRERQAQLRTTRTQLAALAVEPMPMPAAVADRIDAALAGAAATGTVVPMESRRRSWRSHPTAAGLGAAAAAAALITAVAVGSTLHSPKHHVGTNSGAGINPNRVEANAGNFPTQISDQTYTPTTAKDLLAGVAQAGLAQSGAAGPAGVQTPMTATAKQKVPAALQTLYSDHAALLRCAAALAGPNSSVPIAVDFGYFTDPAQRALKAPAVVILLPGPVGKIDAWIVGPNCATAADNNFYFFQRISQPS